MNKKPNFFREKLDAFFCSVSDVFVRPEEFLLTLEVEGDIFRDSFLSSNSGSSGGVDTRVLCPDLVLRISFSTGLGVLLLIGEGDLATLSSSFLIVPTNIIHDHKDNIDNNIVKLPDDD